MAKSTRDYFFYSTPDSATPSPYFRRFPHMLRDISQKGILRFRLWQGSHEAPRPVEEDEIDTLDGKLHDASPAEAE